MEALLENETLQMIREIASWVLLLAGSFITVAGSVGVLRFPDFYSRMHAAAIIDTFGAELLCFGMILQAGLSLVTVKLIFILLFLFFTSPTATHAVANAAYRSGLKPVGRDLTKDEK